MAITLIKDLGKAVRQFSAQRTIGELAAGDGKYYRHPDSAQISYPLAVDSEPVGKIDVPHGMRIAIIGAGAGGIAALYELSRIANASTTGNSITVTLFESDPDNFLFKKTHRQTGNSIDKRNAGRVSSFKAGDQTIYEIGAMRFPEIAGLTWHYAKEAFGGEHRVKAFPNPGTVPTEFHFGSQHDRYFGDDWQDPNSPTKKVRDLIIEGLVGGGAGARFKIGNRDPGAVIPILRSANTPPQELEQIQKDWDNFITSYDGTTLGAAVRQILNHYETQGRLPAITGMTGAERVNWCVELFGRFGFGTGGFKPLFNISLVEMMRLVLWDYSVEYTFPEKIAPSNVDFLENLYNKSLSAKNFVVQTRQGRVTHVLRTWGDTTSAQKDFSTIMMGDVGESQPFHYVIIALPHDAAVPLVSRTGFKYTKSSIWTENSAGGPGKQITPGAGYFGPPLATTDGGSEVDLPAHSRVATAIAGLNMTRSTKVFATVSEALATDPVVPRFNGQPISAIVSDGGLAATYLVPSTINENYRSLLVSYTWDNDSTKLQNSLEGWPLEVGNPEKSAMYTSMVGRAFKPDPFSQGNPLPTWWLNSILARAVPQNRTSFDWTTHTSAGGFKLDNTGDHYQSNLCFRFHTVALKANQRVGGTFLAGCSFSHLGGWLEGAFMTAVNAVAGIVVSENKGDVNALNNEAKKLFTTLKHV